MAVIEAREDRRRRVSWPCRTVGSVPWSDRKQRRRWAMAKVTVLGLPHRDDPIFKEPWTVSGVAQHGRLEPQWDEAASKRRPEAQYWEGVSRGFSSPRAS